jgi:mono/diheme cytochrome c family protein
MRSLLAWSIGVAALSVWTIGVSAQDAAAAGGQHESGAHHHQDAAKMKNPVKSSPASVDAGKRLYTTQCSTCHGPSGKGDGSMASAINPPKPSDLTDASWKHGATDGEIFAVIRDGAKGTSMRGYAARIKPDDTWNVVNYLRTLAPTTAKK